MKPRWLKAVRSVSTLVISDRYPPDAVGGAELSLHISLRSLGPKPDLLVATLSPDVAKPVLATVDGISVLKLPSPADWPFHHCSMATYLRLRSRLPHLVWVGFQTWLISLYIFWDDPRRAYDRGLSLLVWLFLRPRGGVVVDHLTMRAPYLRHLRRLIVAKKPKLIHADNYRSIMAAVDATVIRNVRVIGVVRDHRFFCINSSQDPRIGKVTCANCHIECVEEWTGWSKIHKRMMREAQAFRRGHLLKLARVITTSEFMERELKNFVNPATLTRLPNPIDDPDQVAQMTLGVAERPGTNLVVIGSLNEKKGQLELVRALPQLLQQVPDLHLHLAGRGPRIEQRLRRVLEENGCSDRITIHGYLEREALYTLLRECQIVAAPTVWPEPFGRVPLEAGIAERPIVAFSVGGLKETIEHEVTGLLVKPGDFRAFVDALAKLAKNPEACRRLGREARKRIASRYDAARLSKQLLGVWNSELKQARG